MDQERQIHEVADLREAFEKLKAEHKKQVNLLQARVDTLGNDKSVLEERSKKLQEKNRNLMKEHKGNSLVFAILVAA
jgi:ferritin-like metal-binding protein YciE